MEAAAAAVAEFHDTKKKKERKKFDALMKCVWCGIKSIDFIYQCWNLIMKKNKKKHRKIHARKHDNQGILSRIESD